MQSCVGLGDIGMCSDDSVILRSIHGCCGRRGLGG